MSRVAGKAQSDDERGEPFDEGLGVEEDAAGVEEDAAGVAVAGDGDPDEPESVDPFEPFEEAALLDDAAALLDEPEPPRLSVL